MSDRKNEIILFVGMHVDTIYGIGVIIKIRESDDCIIVEAKDWELANSTKPVLYMNRKSIIPLYKINTKVKTLYGVCEVVGIRKDGIYKCEADKWRMAMNSIPIFYLNQDSIKLQRD